MSNSNILIFFINVIDNNQLFHLYFIIKVESHPSYTGQRIWPRKSEANPRNFSAEKLRAGEAVISLQYGTNKGASQSGMNFGKKRMILKE